MIVPFPFDQPKPGWFRDLWFDGRYWWRWDSQGWHYWDGRRWRKYTVPEIQ